MKRKITLKLLVLALSLSLSGSLYGQLIKAVSVAATTEAVTTPFKRILPIHPGAEIGLNWITNNLDWTGQQLNTYIGFYHHASLTNSLYVKGEYLFQFRIKNALAIELMLNGGYNRNFYPVETFKLNESTKEFEKVSQRGSNSYFVGLGMGLSYASRGSIEPFVRYEVFMETPFIEEINYLPHSLLKIGLHFKFTKDDN